MSLSNDTRFRLVLWIDAQMREAGRLSTVLDAEEKSHPAFYALNRAWHELATARDELTKPAEGPTRRQHAPP